MILDCAMLYVKELARMRAFYASVLQTEPARTEWADTWALFQAGGAKLALHAVSPQHPEGLESSSSPPTRESSPVKLIFIVEDVPAERARLEAVGVTTLHRSWQNPAESCDCVDPEGNIFQIAARLHAARLFGQVSSEAS